MLDKDSVECSAFKISFYYFSLHMYLAFGASSVLQELP